MAEGTREWGKEKGEKTKGRRWSRERSLRRHRGEDSTESVRAESGFIQTHRDDLEDKAST